MRALVLTSLWPGPSKPCEGLFAERRWTGMARRGHAVEVVQPVPLAPPLAGGPGGRWGEIRALPRRELRAGIPVRRPRYLHLPGRDRRNVRAFARAGLRELARGPRPDVVVADYAWPAAGAAPALAQRGIPCVVSGRGSDVLQVAGEAGLAADLARYLRAAGHWCAVSEDLVRAMDRLAGEARGRLVPNGVDLERFDVRERAPARRALGLSPEGPLVLVVGHLIERKDPLLALEAFLRGAPADARCAFVGRGPLRDELERRARAAGAAERVLLAGELAPEALARWYDAADVLLLTSRREGRPNVVLEALASGLAVLATDAGGTAELLRGAEARLLATTRDPGELGRRLAALLADPPPRAELRALVEPLSWERSLDALEACLEEAVAGRAPAVP